MIAYLRRAKPIAAFRYEEKDIVNQLLARGLVAVGELVTVTNPNYPITL